MTCWPAACAASGGCRWLSRYGRRDDPGTRLHPAPRGRSRTVIDMDAVAAADRKIGVDPMGGAGVAFWEPIAERYENPETDVVNPDYRPESRPSTATARFVWIARRPTRHGEPHPAQG